MEKPHLSIQELLNNEEFLKIVEKLNDILLNRQISENSLKRSKEFLKVAEKDLNAAEILYNAKIFSASVFYLQQSVEKAAKAFGVLYNLVPKKKLRKTQHFTPIVFIKILERKWMNDFIKFVKILIHNIENF